ncbi:MAG: DUF1990 family protein [Anaerolineales bacterium]
MFTLTRPADDDLRAYLARVADTPYSYPTAHVGQTIGAPPPGYVIDRNAVYLGHGPAAFAAARRAVQDWKMFDLAWVWLCFPDAPILPGSVVGILARRFGLWSFNPARIVYLVDEPRRYGFGYGTLPGHVAYGEECFMVSQDDAGDVWYSLVAFSRPAHPLFKIGYPLMRALQKRFARGSLAAMAAALKASEPTAQQA